MTSFGGLALTERLALRHGLWSSLEKALGPRGTASCERVRRDGALRSLLGIGAAPPESTFWRDLGRLGQDNTAADLARVQRLWTKRLVASTKRSDLLLHGFVPLFGDGTLLEKARCILKTKARG